MRQVTGRTNRPNDANKVSIQLSLDGHSFSLPTPTEGVAEVELLSAATLLVPRDCYQAEAERALFAATGCAVPQEVEFVVCEAAEQPDAVAVIAVPHGAMEQLQAHYDGVRYTTPLLDAPTEELPVVMVCDTGALIYIKVYDPQLSFAEVVSAESVQEVDFLLQQLATRVDLSRFTLELDLRIHDKMRLKSYKNRFKHLVCV